MNYFIISLLVIVVIALNLWVWVFPNAFISFLKFGKNSLIKIPSQEQLWKFIENPQYIWWPRFILV